MKNKFDLKKFLVENKLTENSRNLNENGLAGAAIQEFLNADSNGVTIAEFVKAMIDGAAATLGDEAEYYDLDEASMSILKAIGREDLIGEGSLKEEWKEESEMQLRQLADQIGFDRLMDKYAPSHIDSLPNIDDYIGDIYDSSGEIGDEFLNPETLKADIIDYAKNL